MIYSKVLDCLESGRNTISENKSLVSGIAIISVVLYHSNPLLFYPGFIGVDFFMFLSGFFLCYSYREHSLKVFYRRRFLRIFPMFFLLATEKILSFLFFKHKSLDIIDILCTYSTLSYYNITGGGCIC